MVGAATRVLDFGVRPRMSFLPDTPALVTYGGLGMKKDDEDAQ